MLRPSGPSAVQLHSAFDKRALLTRTRPQRHVARNKTNDAADKVRMAFEKQQRMQYVMSMDAELVAQLQNLNKRVVQERAAEILGISNEEFEDKLKVGSQLLLSKACLPPDL